VRNTIQQNRTNQIIDSSPFNWKRRPSEIGGYQRTLYCTDDDGDYMRIDYNLREKRVRLYIEVHEEGGSPYYSVIKNGKITAERSVLSGRTFGFSDKFVERADIFASIPNKEVIKLIGNNYGISDVKQKQQKDAVDAQKKKRLEETRKRYFSQEKNPYHQAGMAGRVEHKRLKVIDIVDLAAGAGLAAGVFIYLQYSFIAMGVVSAFYGLSIGMVDMFIRERPPLFFKIILFIVFGFISYVYGYYLS
jgi:hypothetical protein